MVNKSEKIVIGFINENKNQPHGGAPCLMCSHPRRKEIEDASRIFNEQRKLWKEGATEVNADGDEELVGTSLPWDTFVRKCLREEFGYNGRDKRPLVRHLEYHIGITIY